MALEAVKQPVINGYFIAGSLVGPGGAGLIKVTKRSFFEHQVGSPHLSAFCFALAHRLALQC